LAGEVRGEHYSISTSGLICPNCGFVTIEGAQMPEFRRLLADEYRKNHGLLTSTEIRGIRDRLGMSQEAFAKHVGVGVASIKRWEWGKIQDAHHNDLLVNAARTFGPLLHDTCTLVEFTQPVGSTVRLPLSVDTGTFALMFVGTSGLVRVTNPTPVSGTRYECAACSRTQRSVDVFATDNTVKPWMIPQPKYQI